MPRDQEHDIGLPYVLLDVLCDLAVAKQPLGERRPDELRAGVIPYIGRTRANSGATLLA